MPPSAGNRQRPSVVEMATMIEPSSAQLAPKKSGIGPSGWVRCVARECLCRAPLLPDIVSDETSVANPIHCPSGEKNGPSAEPLSGTATALAPVEPLDPEPRTLAVLHADERDRAAVARNAENGRGPAEEVHARGQRDDRVHGGGRRSALRASPTTRATPNPATRARTTVAAQASVREDRAVGASAGTRRGLGSRSTRRRCRAGASSDRARGTARAATRTPAGVSGGSADQSGSCRSTAARTSETVSPSKQRRPVSIS